MLFGCRSGTQYCHCEVLGRINQVNSRLAKLKLILFKLSRNITFINPSVCNRPSIAAQAIERPLIQLASSSWAVNGSQLHKATREFKNVVNALLMNHLKLAINLESC